MSAEENARLVQSAYEAFGQGDMAALAEVMADDIEWVDPGNPDDDPNAGTEPELRLLDTRASRTTSRLT